MLLLPAYVAQNRRTIGVLAMSFLAMSVLVQFAVAYPFLSALA